MSCLLSVSPLAWGPGNFDEGTVVKLFPLGMLAWGLCFWSGAPGTSRKPLTCPFLCWWLWVPFLFAVKAFALILAWEKVENPALFLMPFWQTQHWNALCREWQVVQWAALSIMFVKCWELSERVAVRTEWMHAECLGQCPVYCKWPGDVVCRLFFKLAHSGSGAMSQSNHTSCLLWALQIQGNYNWPGFAWPPQTSFSVCVSVNIGTIASSCSWAQASPVM